MFIRRVLFILFILFAGFPLCASINIPQKNQSSIELNVSNNKNTKDSYIHKIFFSKKKAKDEKLSDEELNQKRDEALAEIEARRAEKEAADRLEQEQLELKKEKELQEQEEQNALARAKAAEEERIAKEQAEKEAERLAKEREKERLEKEKQEKERLEAEKIENERKLAEIAANRYKKEYLSDYIVPELPELSEETDDLYEPILNPDETDASGCTLLMRAAKTGNGWQMKRLIDSGANPNLTDNDGWTALMYAVRYNEGSECIELLLNAKADVKIVNKYGSTALTMAACYNNNPDILTKLLKFYKSSDKEVLRAFVIMLSEQNISEDALLSKMKLFIEMSVPLNSHYDGKTPLMYAAQFGNSNKALKLLMENDASVTVRSTEGKTAFDYAETNKNLARDEYFWALNSKKVR